MEVLPLGRTATLVPEFAVEDLPLGRTATSVLEFAVEDLPLGRIATLVLSLRWKTCLRQNCNFGFCACSEGPTLGQNTDDDDEYGNFKMQQNSVSVSFNTENFFKQCETL